jgi:hypothetical protein
MILCEEENIRLVPYLIFGIIRSLKLVAKRGERAAEKARKVKAIGRESMVEVGHILQARLLLLLLLRSQDDVN